MHYRSTHSLSHTHLTPSSPSFQRISTHAHAPHHKWWDLNINSMKYSCVSARRSSRTNTEGDLPSDLRIPLHSSLSFPLTPLLPRAHHYVAASQPLSRRWAPVSLFVVPVVSDIAFSFWTVMFWILSRAEERRDFLSSFTLNSSFLNMKQTVVMLFVLPAG